MMPALNEHRGTSHAWCTADLLREYGGDDEGARYTSAVCWIRLIPSSRGNTHW